MILTGAQVRFAESGPTGNNSVSGYVGSPRSGLDWFLDVEGVQG